VFDFNKIPSVFQLPQRPTARAAHHRTPRHDLATAGVTSAPANGTSRTWRLDHPPSSHLALPELHTAHRRQVDNVTVAAASLVHCCEGQSGVGYAFRALWSLCPLAGLSLFRASG
jgi:hypothetical protein